MTTDNELFCIICCRYHEENRLLEGNPKYSFWFKRGLSMLNINDVTSEDTGDYTCVATNTVGQCSTMGELHVQGKINYFY